MVWVPENFDVVDLVDAIIREGRTLADEVEILFVTGTAIDAELKKTLIGEVTESRIWGIGIRTIRNGHIGVSSANDPSRWKECLHAAISSGELSTPQEWNGLPVPVDIKKEVPIFDPSLFVDVELAQKLLEQLLEGAREYPADVVGGSASLSQSTIILANSKGVMYEKKKTGAGVSLESIRGTSTGFEYEQSCFLDFDVKDVGRMAAFYAVHSENGKDIASGNYDVVLSPIALAQLIDHIIVPALSGRNVKAGRSYLADQLGEQCMDGTLSLYDDPFTRGLGSTAWDAEGVPTKRIDFIDKGVLGCFAYDLKTAYRFGEESTGSAVRSGPGGSPGIGVHNLVLDGPRMDVDDEKAIFVHNLVGAHTANPITGDFSVELSNPSWIKGGSFEEPIRSAMLAGNIFDMLKDVGGLGRDSRIIGHTILPSVRFNNMRIIGK